MAQDTALIVGATGLIGGYCLKTLLARGDYQSVIALTRRKLGAQDPRLVEMRVDFDNPKIIAERSAAAGAKQFVLVSSVGADPKSGNFYLRVKAEVEKAVSAQPFESVHIFRPSVLIGKRAELRLAEAATV